MNPLAEPGTDVMAPWGDGFLYTAVVVRPDPEDEDKVLVAYWEGDSKSVKAAALRPCAFEVGAKVHVNHLNQNNYQPGRIERRIGGAIQVALENGSLVWTTWAKCRVPKEKKPKPA
jgi:hypothetical protein